MQHLSKLECLALLAGCLCHDVDHRGTNNAFQAKYVTIIIITRNFIMVCFEMIVY